jgi:hypothetical protein
MDPKPYRPKLALLKLDGFGTEMSIKTQHVEGFSRFTGVMLSVERVCRMGLW